MRENVKKAKRVIVKVGTSSLVYSTGAMNLKAIDDLAFVLSDLVHKGYEVALVSSGAMGAGLSKFGLDKRPKEIAMQQAVASVGQMELMNIYNARFSSYNQVIGQVLLTQDVFEYPESRKNVTNTFEMLFKEKIIPIINENDTVSVDELDHETKFGDNDKLAALVTNLTDADLLIMLSDIDGFYSDNPLTNKRAKLISHVPKITDEIMKQAGGSGSRFGTGGMLSKLECAKLLLNNEKGMILTSGVEPRVLFDVVAGEEIGTFFGK
ncbi:glutamate 5-kinase [Pilibacter termitis]|uniref:glutamate 5-kinase n=1 Tax=Pilibacter termitis TaxID=263852 RepID=UPI00099A6922|nr:glutamate 5-kinase [Pilibacter termitis]